MFVFKLKLSRDRVLIVICVLLAVMSLAWHFMFFSNILPKGETVGDRVEYVKKQGYTAVTDSETQKTILIPKEFNSVYTAYNEIQISANFDLSRYRGCGAQLYTYKLDKFGDIKEAKVNLIVYRDKIIGGDITTLEKGGLCLPLIAAEENIKDLKEKQND